MKTYKMMGMLVALVLTSVGVQAAVLLTSVTGTLRDGAADTFSIGYRFTPTNDILVRQLGFVDDDLDGNAVSHNVILWKVTSPTTGVALGSVTVPIGTSSTLIDGFRYVTLATSITLTNGTAYALSADVYGSSGDRWYDGDATFGLGLPVTINGVEFGYTPSAYPNNFFAGSSVYGTANLLGDELVPEPCSVLLLGLGGLLVWARRRENVR